MKLTVTVITRDEAANIAAALQSVSWADEIIVVDSQSRDDTVSIARKLATRVEVREWPGYSAQKNYAASMASNDWILSLDADERVTPELASEIQQRFQPTAPPIVSGYEFQGISFPCYEIGGDYYDFIKRDDGRLVIALGDVSGKGTAAALLMSSLHASIHAQTGSHDTLVQTISAVNRYLAENIPSNRFVTLFYAELDPDSGALSFLNAGHNPPLIVHAAGTVEQLASGGLPLGIKADADYREGRTTLQPGDVLVIYSDGVTEAASPNGEEFGPTRLYEVVSRNVEASAAGIRDRIESALTKFSQGTQAADDITLVIVKRQAETRALTMSGIRELSR